METFYWHDYETWGVSPALDRPSQFAGIRTDRDFNIVGKPLNILCRPSLDTVPHVEACLVTGLSPMQVADRGSTERDFFAAIHDEFIRPQTCAVGYNNVRFDDEFTRYGFYRNFYDAYAREWQGGNSRWDIIDLVRLCYAVRPEGIAWPKNDHGVVTFRLEELTKANGLSHDAAHDALSDVYATIALAKKIKATHPKLFDHVLARRSKQLVLQDLQVGSGKPLLHISSKFGAELACTSLILPIAQNPLNKNEIFCVDLRYPPSPLFEYSAEQLASLLYTRTEALPEGVERIPLKSVHINRCPIVLSPGLLDDKVASRAQLDKTQCEQHRQALLGFNGLEAKLMQVYSSSHFDEKSRDVDAMLYDGFISNRDKSAMRDIPMLSGVQLSEQSFSFEDKRLPELLFRYRARNFPETLTPDENRQWLEHCAEKWYVGEPTLLASELIKVRSYRDDITVNQHVIAELEQYLLQIQSILERGAVH